VIVLLLAVAGAAVAATQRRFEDAPTRPALSIGVDGEIGLGPYSEWLVVGGTFVADGGHIQRTDNALAPAFALHPASAAGTDLVLVTTDVRDGDGLVLRFLDDRNYWLVTWSVEFATWNVGKVKEGRLSFVANTGAVAGDAPALRVADTGGVIRLWLGDTMVQQVIDGDFAAVPWAGLYAEGQKDPPSRFSLTSMALPVGSR
jgi:hypothetical protein